jgi:anaphase-promoting complex subunit 4
LYRYTLFDHFNPPTRLTVLCSGDARGSVVLSAFGIFPVGSAELAAANFALTPPSAEIAVQHASLSPDLSRVLVAFSASSSSTATSHAATAAVPLLAARSREVCQIAAHGSQVTRLMSEIEGELAGAAKNWSKAWGDFEGKIGTLHARLITGWEMSEDGDGVGSCTT